jgi:hypothetical protein
MFLYKRNDRDTNVANRLIINDSVGLRTMSIQETNSNGFANQQSITLPKYKPAQPVINKPTEVEQELVVQYACCVNETTNKLMLATKEI